MRIGELARRAGVSTSRVRFYEARELLPPAARLATSCRDYDNYVLQVVRFVHRSRCLGFTLHEIAEHLRSPEGDGRKARLEAKPAELSAHQEEVRARRAAIAGIIEEIRGARAV